MKIIKWLFIVPVAVVLLGVIGTEINKAYWDYQVRQMCEKDGGVTVYEKVELTLKEYEKYGGFNGAISAPPKTASYADKYPYLSTFEKEIIHKSNPSVYRWEATIYRKSDKKIFGKVVSYHRGGGDFPTIISHPSGFDCKDMNIKLNIEEEIFYIKGEK